MYAEYCKWGETVWCAQNIEMWIKLMCTKYLLKD